TIAITLEPDAVAAYDSALASRGWRALAWPLLVDEPAGAPLPDETDACGWIAVTSPRGAAYAAEAYARLPRARIAALGPSTARALRRRGLPVHAVSAQGSGASLARTLAAFPTAPAPVLLVQVEDALPDLVEGLRA